MVVSYLAIGSNMGDRQRNIERAVIYLKELAGVRIKKESSVYETPPVGGPLQGDYLNGVIEIETALLPDELLDRIKGIESRLGRVKGEENGPRPIDLDILFYADVVISGGRLKIPHPRLHEREFVLRGLNEIAPGFIHPKLGLTVGELYAHVQKAHENTQIDHGAAPVPQPPERAA